MKGKPFGLWINPDDVTSSGSDTYYSIDVNSCSVYFNYYATPLTNQEMIEQRVGALVSTYDNLTIDVLEYRYVNNEKYIFLETHGDYGTSHQITSGYYRADKNGYISVYCVVQVGSNYDKSKNTIRYVMNGIVIINN